MAEKTTMTTVLKPLSLESIADGSAEEQFQRALAEVTEIFSVPSDGVIPWKLSNGTVSVQINLAIAFVHDFESGMTSVAVESEVKRPKVKRVARPVLMRDGVLYSEPSGDQLSLLTRRNDRENNA